MKSSSMFTVAAIFAAMTIAAPASAAPIAAVYTMTDAVVTQMLIVTPGCKKAKFGGTATATFFADNTYSIVRTGAGDTVPAQTGSYSVESKKSSYSVSMSPDDASLTALLGNYSGMDTSAWFTPVVGALGELADANCKLKYPAATVSVLAPTVLASANTMVVDNSTKSATLTYKLNGKQENNFKGTKKVGTFKATITMKGTVVETPVVL